jgi:hypothetical protein
VQRAEVWLMGLSGAYEGDLVTDEVRPTGALAALLRQPAVYVRGPVDAFGSPRTIAEAAATSAKDAVLLCLMDPPASRKEGAALERLRGASPIEEHTANVRRLDDAIVGLPFLMPPWSDRVRASEDAAEIARLRKELERAPLARAKQAAAARLLVAVIDEPGDGRTPTELDGENAHHVRVAIVDAVADKILLRMRKHVDPSWISVERRPTHSRKLDGCALAFDVHQALR